MKTVKRYTLSAIIGLIASLSLASGLQAAEKKAITSDTLIVNFDDIQGYADFRIEDIREDLLHNAFYDANRRVKLADEYEVTYNGNISKRPKNLLNVRVVDWRRSRANFYEFRAVATYYDADGKAVDLGVISGTRSGIGVFTAYDVGDHFEDVAEDALRSALKKLEKQLS